MWHVFYGMSDTYTPNYRTHDTSPTSGSLTYYETDGTDFTQGSRCDDRSNIISIDESAGREGETVETPIPSEKSTFPCCHMSSWKSVVRSQCSTPIFRIPARGARQREWTGRNFHKVK